MPRSLHGLKYNNGPVNFQSHLTDMRLGLGGLLPSGAPNLEAPDRPLPNWTPDTSFQARFSREFFAGRNDGSAASSSNPPESPFLLNSLGSSYLDSFRGKRDDVPTFGNLPGHNKVGRSDVPDPAPVSDSRGKEEATASPKGKLPHWLREAVNAPSKTTEPGLPPIVSAIERSVRVLYGERSSKIPPFVIPGPPPQRPKDPLRDLKIKKKKKKRSSGLAKLPENKDHAEHGSSSTAQVPEFTPTGISTSPEVLELVPCVEPSPISVDEQKVEPASLPGVEDQEANQEATAASGKTVSDPLNVVLPDGEEISSEGTVSDDPASERES